MIISEVEVDTPEEWLSTLIALEKQIKEMERKSKHKWKIESGMIKNRWYIKDIANENNLKDIK